MIDKSSQSRERAEAQFKKQQKAAEQAHKANIEYEVAAQATREKTARLKSLRLAKEAADTKLKVKPVTSS